MNATSKTITRWTCPVSGEVFNVCPQDNGQWSGRSIESSAWFCNKNLDPKDVYEAEIALGDNFPLC